MASHKSAEKQHRRDLKRRENNRLHKSRMRTAIKKLRAAVGAGETDRARQLLPATLALVDRSAKVGVIHTNAASRTKSRLMIAVSRATGA